MYILTLTVSTNYWFKHKRSTTIAQKCSRLQTSLYLKTMKLHESKWRENKLKVSVCGKKFNLFNKKKRDFLESHIFCRESYPRKKAVFLNKKFRAFLHWNVNISMLAWHKKYTLEYFGFCWNLDLFILFQTGNCRVRMVGLSLLSENNYLKRETGEF